MTETAIRLAIASLAISITMGVFLHDSHLDMATVSAITRVDLTSKDVAEGRYLQNFMLMVNMLV